MIWNISEKWGPVMAEEKKKRKPFYDLDAQLRYQAKLKQLNFRVKEEEYKRYVSFAQSKGMTLRGFVLRAIEEKIERG